MLDEEIRYASGHVDCSRGSYGSAIVVGSDRYVIPCLQYGNPAHAADSPLRDIRPHDVDETFAQERLEYTRISAPAPKTQRRHRFAGQLAPGLDASHRTGLIEQQRMGTLDSVGNRG